MFNLLYNKGTIERKKIYRNCTVKLVEFSIGFSRRVYAILKRSNQIVNELIYLFLQTGIWCHAEMLAVVELHVPETPLFRNFEVADDGQILFVR